MLRSDFFDDVKENKSRKSELLREIFNEIVELTKDITTLNFAEPVVLDRFNGLDECYDIDIIGVSYDIDYNCIRLLTDSGGSLAYSKYNDVQNFSFLLEVYDLLQDKILNEII